MSRELIARIKKSRETEVKVDKFTFIIRRPTDVEAVALSRESTGPADVAQKFVVGWKGITEDDVVGGGGSEPVAFDVDLWREWCADNPAFWAPIAEAALKAYEAHAKDQETSAKN